MSDIGQIYDMLTEMKATLKDVQVLLEKGLRSPVPIYKQWILEEVAKKLGFELTHLEYERGLRNERMDTRGGSSTD